MNNHNSDQSTSRRAVKTPLAPAAIGPYNQGILAGNTLYCSGQLGIDPETGSMVPGGAEAEAERLLQNLGAVLKAAQMDYRNVVRCTVFLADINDYGAVNDVYARYFSELPPAREAVEVSALPRGARGGNILYRGPVTTGSGIVFRTRPTRLTGARTRSSHRLQDAPGLTGNSSSTRNENPANSPPASRISFAVAAAVPPVAITSS